MYNTGFEGQSCLRF